MQPMHRLIHPFSMCFAASACTSNPSNQDHEVFVDVESAFIVVDASRPADLAEVDVVVTLDAGTSANHTVLLERAYLREPEWEAYPMELVELGLSFPDDFSGRLLEGQSLDVELINVDTVNEELVSLCDVETHMIVTIRYVEDSATTMLSWPFPVTVECTST